MPRQSTGTLSRRDFCKVVGVSLASSAGHSDARMNVSEEQSEPGELIVRSDRFLSIGINRKTGAAFVEEKSSGEVWVWNWKDVRAASSNSMALKMANYEIKNISDDLKPITPESIVPLTDGFELRYSLDWGRFNCSVQLAGAGPDVLFKVQPELRHRCDLTAIQFPSTLHPETHLRPALVDTMNGGRLHRPSARAESFALGSERCWMRYYGVLGKKSAYLAI